MQSCVRKDLFYLLVSLAIQICPFLLQRGVQQRCQQIVKVLSVGVVSVNPLVKCGAVPRHFSAAKDLNIQINTFNGSMVLFFIGVNFPLYARELTEEPSGLNHDNHVASKRQALRFDWQRH